MENILQGVANSSSIPQDMHVFVSLCVWGVGGVTAGSSLQPLFPNLTEWEDMPQGAIHPEEAQGGLCGHPHHRGRC